MYLRGSCTPSTVLQPLQGKVAAAAAAASNASLPEHATFTVSKTKGGHLRLCIVPTSQHAGPADLCLVTLSIKLAQCSELHKKTQY